MAIFTYPVIFFSISLIVILLCFMKTRKQKKTSIPTNWPVLGMLPRVLQNSHRIHDYATEILRECNGTFEFIGPWFCNMDMLITSEPSNIHHILSKNFTNYPKGPEFRKIFDILGDGIFNADFELWELHRRTTLSFMSGSRFYSLLERSVWQKVESGLIPVLDHFAKKGSCVDLQDVFQRFTFDSICQLVLDYDPCSLCIDLPHIPCEKAFNGAVEALLHRHILPERIYKLQKWLRVGKEKLLIESWKAFDEFIYPCVEKGVKRTGFKLLTDFKKAYEEKRNLFSKNSVDFLRDTSLSLMLAGRDTTSTCLTWLFWLIAANPLAVTKIREEIETELHVMEGENWRNFGAEVSRKLVYLHGALCESLRLFPPVALEHKAPVRHDILPSGHFVPRDKMVVLSFYSMGRMEMIWGKDCLDFKPERWITGCGGIKHEPSFKFPAFNAGPRTCLGKEMAFVQMKMVAATIIYHYDIHVVEGFMEASPLDSIIIQMKKGLRVKLSRRNV